MNEFEFDPTLILPSSESKIPDQVNKEILNVRQDLNSKVLRGFLEDEVIYFTVNNKLFLWQSEDKIHGIIK